MRRQNTNQERLELENSRFTDTNQADQSVEVLLTDTSHLLNTANNNRESQNSFDNN